MKRRRAGFAPRQETQCDWCWATTDLPPKRSPAKGRRYPTLDGWELVKYPRDWGQKPTHRFRLALCPACVQVYERSIPEDEWDEDEWDTLFAMQRHDLALVPMSPPSA